MPFTLPHLLGIRELDPVDVIAILDKAEGFAKTLHEKKSSLSGKIIFQLFYENSTRTRTSFELAGKRLGADVINIPVAQSSVKKGETFIDTALTLDAMRPDIIILRHGESGASHLLSRSVEAAVINAGDGCHEHPTQALLDAFTIRRHCGRIKGLKIAICGDILHSRVARSNALLLGMMGAEVHLIAPPTLMPQGAEIFGAQLHHDMAEGIKDADIVMMLRLQQERMHGHHIASAGEYYHFYGLDDHKLALAKPQALVLHPGPINRGVEISSPIADHAVHSLILKQVSAGIAVRQAILSLIAESRP